MTKEQWFKKVTASQDSLIKLIQDFHPAALHPKSSFLSITASNAEAACAVVRQDIRKNFEGDPVWEFITAIAHEDTKKIYSLLSHAWFGVPESTACWRVPGFREAVDLLDEPPE